MARAWGSVVAIALALGAAPACAAADDAALRVAVAARGGTLALRPNPELFDRLGVRVDGFATARGEWRFPLAPVAALQVELGDGAPTRVRGGELSIPALELVRTDGKRAPALALVPDPARAMDWNLVDAEGAVWLRITHGMRSPQRQRDGLRLITADLRVGPALAAWSGVDAADRLLANASLQLPLEPVPFTLADQGAAKSCSVPNFPGTPGFVTDVTLTDIDRVDVLRCRTLGVSGCDGPGGADGDVVLVPSATLRNRDSLDASDVPWHVKFGGVFPPYNNDQHPFLVWNLYRIDADGALQQIARSGLKHAFATANTGCLDDTCRFTDQILGRGCSDLYNAGSNDIGFLLTSRREVIPARGLWGRCGSVFDDQINASGNPGCDGVQDAGPADDGYLHRLVARESDIDATTNAGASWLVDAWYVVRDDADIRNTMGYRTLQPQFAGGLWSPGSLGPFRNGPVVEHWLQSALPSEDRGYAEVSSAEGHVAVATRVSRMMDGRYRYDYALMSLDFTRAVTDPSTAEPNLRITRNLGISGIAFELANGASVDASEIRDGDALVANDWTSTVAGGQLVWTPPSGLTFEWGQLLFVRVTSTAAPGTGALRFDVAEAGTPGSYSVATLVPDGAKILRNGFE